MLITQSSGSKMRPGHADHTAYEKYGGFNDWRGGARFSGALPPVRYGRRHCQKALNHSRCRYFAHGVEIGGVQAKEQDYAL